MRILNDHSMETSCCIHLGFCCALLGNRIDAAGGVGCTRETTGMDGTDQSSADTEERRNNIF
jgi:hypothetical protein